MPVGATNAITDMQIQTAEQQKKTETLKGAARELTSADFLNLMLKQMEYQDPMDPQDNSQMIAQQAQFSQLKSSQEISSTLSSFSGSMRATSLVGKGVVLQDPSDSKKTISGTVSAALIDGANSAVVVGGKNYPLKYVMYSYDPDKTKVTGGADSTTGTGTGTTTGTGTGTGTATGTETGSSAGSGTGTGSGTTT